MSLFKDGYFTILPKELRKELTKYVFEMSLELITLETLKTSYMFKERIKDDNEFYLENITLLDFNIVIELPEVYADENPTFVFQMEFQQLQEFIKFFRDNYASLFEFIDKNTLNIIEKVVPNKNSEEVKLAQVGLIKNIEEGNCINLEHKGSNYLAFTYFSEAGRIVIYGLTEIQSEILLYKLIQFYNDLITMNPENIDAYY